MWLWVDKIQRLHGARPGVSVSVVCGCFDSVVVFREEITRLVEPSSPRLPHTSGARLLCEKKQETQSQQRGDFLAFKSPHFEKKKQRNITACKNVCGRQASTWCRRVSSGRPLLTAPAPLSYSFGAGGLSTPHRH